MGSSLRSPRLRVWLVCALAALCVDAVRLDARSVGANAGGSFAAAAAESAAPARGDAAPLNKLDHDRELYRAAAFVDAVNIGVPMTLSFMRDILYKFEDYRQRVIKCGHGVKDARARKAVHIILRDIRTKTEALNRLAAQKEAEGEVDDGGDVLPSERKNICNNVDNFDMDASFRADVQSLCEALDLVRLVVANGEDEEAAVFEVSGRLQDLRVQPAYAKPQVSLGIAMVLGEEYRWVTKQLARRPKIKPKAKAKGGSGKPKKTPKSADDSPRGLQSWVTDIQAVSFLVPTVREQRLKDALELLQGMDSEGSTLSVLRTNLERLMIARNLLAECITTSDPDFRARINEVLVLIKDKAEALEVRAQELDAAGEYDEVTTLFPSQRNNVCKHLDTYELPTDWHEDVKTICDSLDRLRLAALNKIDPDPALMEVIGRMNALKSKPGYKTMPIAGKLEVVFAEEWRWLNDFLAMLKDTGGQALLAPDEGDESESSEESKDTHATRRFFGDGAFEFDSFEFQPF